MRDQATVSSSQILDEHVWKWTVGFVISGHNYKNKLITKLTMSLSKYLVLESKYYTK